MQNNSLKFIYPPSVLFIENFKKMFITRALKGDIVILLEKKRESNTYLVWNVRTSKLIKNVPGNILTKEIQGENAKENSV